MDLIRLHNGPLSGREIADAWRRTDPLRGIAPNWSGLLRGPGAPSLFTMDRYRRNVFREIIDTSGMVFVRVERSGSGDSEGVPCEQLDDFPPSA